ncbi:retrovirus-related pol polyprotein from transposon TNT 1-94 [Tanacetum coccineum]
MNGAKLTKRKISMELVIQGFMRMQDPVLFIQYGCEAALEVLPTDMEAEAKAELNKKAHSAVILCLGNKVLREVTGETTAAGVWTKLETLYMTKLVDTLALLDGKSLTFGDVMATLNYKETRKGEKSRSKSRGGRLKCYICQSDDHLKRNCPKNNRKKSTSYVKKDDQPSSSGSTYDDSEVMMVMSTQAQALLDLIMDSGCSYHMTPRNLISLGTLEKEGFTVKLQSEQSSGDLCSHRVVLSGTRKDNCVYSLDGHAMAGELNASIEEKDSLAQEGNVVYISGSNTNIEKVQRVETISAVCKCGWELNVLDGVHEARHSVALELQSVGIRANKKPKVEIVAFTVIESLVDSTTSRRHRVLVRILLPSPHIPLITIKAKVRGEETIYYSHNNEYLEICRCYKSIYEIPSVKEDPAKWTPVNNLAIWLLNVFKNVFLSQSLLKQVITMDVIQWTALWSTFKDKFENEKNMLIARDAFVGVDPRDVSVPVVGGQSVNVGGVTSADDVYIEETDSAKPQESE